MAKSDDQLRAAALAKVKQVVLFEPSDSALGLSLLEAGGGLVPADVLRSILEDTFVKKATNTVAKRATDFYKFAVWQVCENQARPLHPCEGDLYKYMCHMRDSGAAPTAPTSFLAAWRFMIYSVGVKLPNAPLTISARVEGVAYACHMTKRPLKQAPHLPVSAIKGLEQLVFTGSVLQACLAGFMLFCMFCAARFGDAAKATGLSVDHSGRVFLMETAMFGCKTAAKAEEKSKEDSATIDIVRTPVQRRAVGSKMDGSPRRHGAGRARNLDASLGRHQGTLAHACHDICRGRSVAARPLGRSRGNA